MGTALARHQSQTDIAKKAAAYGIPGEAVDGMDVLAVEEATGRAAQSVRAGGGPLLLELRSYRFRAHSMYDAELYRSKNEVEQWKQRDPIVLAKTRWLEEGRISRAEVNAMEQDVERELDEAVAFAEAGNWEPVDDLLKDVQTPPAPSPPEAMPEPLIDREGE
jgi:TPP-dependent pyruvate/acetoin dehydrogenase alpha subunit